MKKIPFVFLLISCIRIIAQNPNLDYKTAIKVYNISTLQIIRHGVYFGTYNTPSYNLEIMHPALAIQWQMGKQNFHEVELTRLLVNKKYNTYDIYGPAGAWEPGGSRNVTDIALRYEYRICFAKKRDRKFVPSLGFGLAPSFFRNSFDPNYTSQYDLSTTTVALEGQIIPGLNYHLNSRFYLDLNIPVSVASFGITTSKNTNPQIPVQQQKISNFDFLFLESFYTVRLGLGFKF
jgi:hypothetical protein